MRALIVEDDLALSFLWKETLQDAEFDCVVHSSCEGAVQSILSEPFDLFVLDLFVDDGTTIGLSDWIETRTPGVPIIMLTGSNVFPEGQHMTEATSVDWFLRKPVSPSDLCAMAQYLAGSAQRQHVMH